MSNEVAAHVLEIISLICITISLVPQIVLNYRLRNTAGLSTMSVMLWVVSGEVSSVYLIWTEQMVIISIAYGIFVGMGIFIICQIIFYEKHTNNVPITKSNVFTLFTQRYLFFIRDFSVSVIICLMTGLGMYFLFEISESQAWIPKLLGSVIPVIVDAISFVPQLVLIIKTKSTAGYSILFILTEVAGALCGVISVCLHDEIDVTPLISFSSVAVFQLVILVFKLFIFRSNRDQNIKIWPEPKENVSTNKIDEKQSKCQSKGFLYVPAPINKKRAPDHGSSQDIQEFVVGKGSYSVEMKFPIDNKFKILFQREMQAYGVKPNDTEESIVRMFANQMPNDEPFYIADISHCARQYLRWSHYLPRVKAFYAVKTNPNSFIIKVIGKMGGGFDCASAEELKTVLSVIPDLDCSTRVIYANPCKQISHIKYFRERGVRMTVVDNELELIKLKEHWPDVKVLIRLKTDDSNSLTALSTKYGATENVAIELLALAKRINVAVVGCAFHVGSGCYNQSVFSTSIQSARRIFDIAKSPEYGLNLSVLNIGGGFPGTDEDGKPSFVSMAKVINQALEQYFPSSEGIQYMAEPGRYFAAACMNLVTSVIGCRRNHQKYVKKTLEKRKESSLATKTLDDAEYVYYITDGIFGSFGNISYEDATYKVNCFRKKRNTQAEVSEKLYNSAVFGPTCDSADRVSSSTDLPLLEIGDYFYVYHVGAYSNSVASSFNGFKTTKYFYIYKG